MNSCIMKKICVDMAIIKLQVNALSSKTSLKTLYFHIISIKFNADKVFFSWISKDEIHWLLIFFFFFSGTCPGISNSWWAERSHLPILGADAHMLSTFIQTDLVDLHWTLWTHNIIFFERRQISLRRAKCCCHFNPLSEISEKAKGKKIKWKFVLCLSIYKAEH